MPEFISNAFPDILNGQAFLRVVIRLATALVLGGVIGFERQMEKKSAGARTHMMVALGTALFALIALESNPDSKDFSRVIQGVAAGIGFLGAAAIIKVSSENEPKGLTTAAGIWMTAAIGLAAGAGLLWTAVSGVVLAWLVLGVFHVVEKRWRQYRKRHRLGGGEDDSPVILPPP